MRFLRRVWAIVWKDVTSELRTKEIFTSMSVFSLLVIVIFNFVFDPGISNLEKILPGILWVAFTFAGVLGLNRSFIFEKDKDCLQGLMLCPVDRSAIYLGKMIGNVIFMLVVEVIALPIFSVLFNFSIWTLLYRLSPILVLATLGFAAVGTVFSAMSVNTKTREVMLPILLFPITIPVMIAAVKSTGSVLEGASLLSAVSWLNLLVVFDVIFLAVSFLTFEFVIEE
jgi:heme exporter protein B